MIIDKNTRPYVVRASQPIVDALSVIDQNRMHLAFVVGDDGTLVGALSDGDFRRSLMSRLEVNLESPVETVMNHEPRMARADDPEHVIARLLDSNLGLVPLIDDRGRLIAIARKWHKAMMIGDREISADTPAFLIAEIGINHNGSLERGLELVDLAAEAGADCAKFQMRDMGNLYRNAAEEIPDDEDLGAQYVLDLLSTHSLDNDEMFLLFDRCKERGLIPLCTPWDINSLQVLVDYGIPGLKVASADLTNLPLLEAMGETGLPIIASTGMSSEAEIEEAIRSLRASHSPFALLHCNSTYPAPFKDVNLKYLERLQAMGDCIVGYSGHERGYEVPLAAVAMGSKIVEKHFTTDRGLPGNDHKVSLLPDEFGAMVTAIRNVEAALGTTAVRRPTQGEMMNRVNLAKSLVANKALDAGHVITAADIDIKSPGRGLQPNLRASLIGRRLDRSVPAGDFFYSQDLYGGRDRREPWQFDRPWGVPVRFHDYRDYLTKQPDFVEFHMTYRDMEMDLSEVLPDALGVDVAVHAPDLFEGDHLLNLAATDDAAWQRSIDELQRTADLAREIARRAGMTAEPVLVASLGGFTQDSPADPSELSAMYERVEAGLRKVDFSGLRLAAQTLPPFPWYLGGQLYCNLFVTPWDTVDFCKTFNRRICLDISHTRLAATHTPFNFNEAITALAPHVEHLHLVDGEGVDGEGVQVGEGDVDWPSLVRIMRAEIPHAGFIPEIWMGHKDSGEGFWTALDRLEALMGLANEPQATQHT